MRLKYLLKCLMSVGCLVAGINCFAGGSLNMEYQSMTKQDQERLLKICQTVKSSDESIKARVMENASEYEKIIGELTEKYPKLSFVNPCKF